MKRSFIFTILALIVFTIDACTVGLNQGDPAPTIPPLVNPSPVSVEDASTPLPQSTPVITLPTSGSKLTEIAVFFMDENRFLSATEPYEVAVARYTGSVDLPLAVLAAYFAGPTQAEYDQGLRPHTSGFTHVRELSIENGIARVYLGGTCANNGAAYSVAVPLMRNLLQFPEIKTVKIYDENDSTLDPDSAQSSLPYCLEP